MKNLALIYAFIVVVIPLFILLAAHTAIEVVTTSFPKGTTFRRKVQLSWDAATLAFWTSNE